MNVPLRDATACAAPAPSGFTRRTALKLGLVGLAGAAAGAGVVPVLHRLAAASPRYRVLTDAEADLLTLVCDQIIPRDDVPGAAEAGAVDFIDRQLAGAYAHHVPTYRQGLIALEQTSRETYGREFARLVAAQRIALLRAVEAGAVRPEPWGRGSASAFFETVLQHTMQGFYGSPRHGGNRDFASYRMLGLSLPQVLGQNRYART